MIMDFNPISDGLEQIAKTCVNAAFNVHKALGPGLLESVYEACMAYELRKAGLYVDRQLALPIVYDGHELDEGFRLDLLVENMLIVELKSAERIVPLYMAQTMTYLKLSKRRLGLLINFNVPVIKDGIKRVVVG
jgi:GxxExxY protein